VLRYTTISCGGSAFYDFLPYKFGPYSFTLYHEVANLCRDGFIAEGSDETWETTPVGRAAAHDIAPAVREDIYGVLEEYGRLSTRELLESVYERYPWFTILSEVERKRERPVAEPGVYTAGYEGLSIDSFLNRLLESGIQRVIDVRMNPVARRYGFHRKTLAGLCEKLGLEYVHFPELGVRSEERQGLETCADYEALFARYERRIVTRQMEGIRTVASLVSKMASVLVCVEADPSRCHRTHLAIKIGTFTNLPVRDLGMQ
jgi:uncharacterized protein (DUF488 family)